MTQYVQRPTVQPYPSMNTQPVKHVPEPTARTEVVSAPETARPMPPAKVARSAIYVLIVSVRNARITHLVRPGNVRIQDLQQSQVGRVPATLTTAVPQGRTTYVRHVRQVAKTVTKVG